jgi:hypothetical protein
MSKLSSTIDDNSANEWTTNYVFPGKNQFKHSNPILQKLACPAFFGVRICSPDVHLTINDDTFVIIDGVFFALMNFFKTLKRIKYFVRLS